MSARPNRPNAIVDARDLQWQVVVGGEKLVRHKFSWREPDQGFDEAFVRNIRGVTLQLFDSANARGELFEKLLQESYLELHVGQRRLGTQPSWRCHENFNPPFVSRGGEVCELWLTSPTLVLLDTVRIGVAIRSSATLAEAAKIY